jgi:MscS family membrane protein
MSEFLDQTFYGNTVSDYLWFVGAIVAALILRKWLSHLISSFIFLFLGKSRYEVGLKQFEQLVSKPLSWLLILTVILIGSNHIEFPAEWNLAPKNEFGIRMLLGKSFNLLMSIFSMLFLVRTIDFFALLLAKRALKTDSKFDDQLITFGRESVKVIVIIVYSLFIVSNTFDVDITALAAGLGIGGIALAMASKESLENLIGSFTIFLDKPFMLGDFITVGGITGTVEKIGFRSTRLRTLEKSYVTVPNKKMVDAELDNLTLRTFRRVKHTIGLTYATTSEQIRNICIDIQNYLDDHEETNEDGRVHFDSFGDSSLDVLVFYFIDTTSYDVFLEVRENVNFKIMEIVSKHGSSFAFPTRSIFMETDK